MIYFSNLSTAIPFNKIRNLNYKATTNADTSLTMGSVCSSSIEFDIIDPPNIQYTNAIFVNKEESSNNLINKETFYVTDVEKYIDHYHIVGYDYISKLGELYTHSGTLTNLSNLWAEVKTNVQSCGATMDNFSGTDYALSNPKFPDDMTVGQAVSYLAGCLGKYAYMDGTTIKFGWYSATGTAQTNSEVVYNSNKLLTETMLTIKSIVTGTLENPIVKGDGTLGLAITFENPWITDAMATAIYNAVYNKSFYPMDVNLSKIRTGTNLPILAGSTIQVDNKVMYVMAVEYNITNDSKYVCKASCFGDSAAKVNFDTQFHSISDINVDITPVQQAISNLTTAIVGNTGGYVKLHDSDNDGTPDEILIMDLPVVTGTGAATKVWRWNKNGLGFSSTGYNGSYRTGINSNGEITADKIVANSSISAPTISGGTISGTSVTTSSGSIGGWDITDEGISAEAEWDNKTWNISLISPEEALGGAIEWKQGNNSIRLVPTYRSLDGVNRYALCLDGPTNISNPTLFVGDLNVGGRDYEGHLYLNGTEITGGGSEPAAYLKSASVSGNTLTLTKKDNTTVTFTPTAKFG